MWVSPLWLSALQLIYSRSPNFFSNHYIYMKQKHLDVRVKFFRIVRRTFLF